MPAVSILHCSDKSGGIRVSVACSNTGFGASGPTSANLWFTLDEKIISKTDCEQITD